MSIVLAVALITGTIPLNIGRYSSNIKKAKAAALTFEVGEGSASKPAFNSANFPNFDKDTGNTQYYFGKYGNAFYGVGTNGIDSNGNTCGFTDSTTWELVDTDADFNGKTLESEWGSENSGSKILYYTAGLISNFSAADQKAMKSGNVSVDTYLDVAQSLATTGYGSTTAKLWPLSVKQYTNDTFYSSDNFSKSSNALAAALYSNSGDEVWSRSYAGYHGYSNYRAWNIGDRITDGVSSCKIDYALLVAPAFALDLNQVLKVKDYNGGKKFLINAGSTKSGFTVSSIAGKKLTNAYNGKTYEFSYSGASTSQLNGGTNYVSAIIYDNTGKAVYYGNLGTIDSESGTAQITIPSNLTVGQNYTLALFEEEVCDGGKTDYASQPVYAKFTAKDKYNLSFDATTNGGTTSASTISEIEPNIVYDSNSPALKATALKEGWTFVGWNTDKDAHTALTSLTMDSDKTLYAIFKKDLTVTFIDAGS